MKDTNFLFGQYLAAFQGSCPSWAKGVCSKSLCTCKGPAEVHAINTTLLPRDCFNKHLSDFVGEVPGEGPVLTSEVVAAAKAKLVRYIWGDLKFDGSTDFNAPDVLKHSVLARRKAEGTSLVIYGEGLQGSLVMEQKDDHFLPRPQMKKRSVGRTLLASIVMKEAVRQRLFPGHINDTYEWVPFPALKSRVTDKDRESIRPYQTCDWLVVDAIHPLEKVSDNMKGFMLEKLNSVFVERTEARLPTILVFQYDIRHDLKTGVLHEKVGLGLSQIVEQDTTVRICLTNQPAK